MRFVRTRTGTNVHRATGGVFSLLLLVAGCSDERPSPFPVICPGETDPQIVHEEATIREWEQYFYNDPYDETVSAEAESLIEDALAQREVLDVAKVVDIACRTTVCRLKHTHQSIEEYAEFTGELDWEIPWDHHTHFFLTCTDPVSSTVLMSMRDQRIPTRYFDRQDSADVRDQ